MSTPVSNILTNPAAVEAAAAYTTPPAPLSPVGPGGPGFVLSTADISQSAQALSLAQQGESPAQIAQALGTTIAIVDGYLGIPVATTSAAPATPPPSSPPASTAAPATPAPSGIPPQTGGPPPLI